MSIDHIIEARWIIPIEPANLTLHDHCVLVSKGKIAGILPTAQARALHPGVTRTELPQHVLIPGLVNLHGHAAMSLLRGVADDLPLMRWLQEAIWPAEQEHVSAQFVYQGSLLAAAEMLRGGITCLNDMYFYPDASARAFHEAGLRAMVGITVIDLPTSYASDADDYLHKGLMARDAWKDEALIRFAMAPHAPYTISDTSFERINAVANELDLPIHMHIHETQQEIIDGAKQYGVRPIDRLNRLGLLGPNLIGVHCVHLNVEEIELFAHHRVSVAHNPSSNMKLASGIAPIGAMLQTGVNIGLGTDGAASNNRLDMFQEMRHAALLAKVASADASVLPAHTALRMATLNGARALGWDGQIGSIEVGKDADLCAVALNSLETQPCYDPASHLVYAAGREHVTHVWVCGRQKLANGMLLQISNSDLLQHAQAWQAKICKPA